jgi:carbohydrate kinase (thermoresistant glucokinase family)
MSGRATTKTARKTKKTAPTRVIEDYALIGSTYGAALVHRDGNIEWLCLPRFDSAAMFASILGGEDNGHWAMQARDRKARVTRRYLPGTVVLETTVHTATGSATVTDFMPRPAPGGAHELVRIVRGVRGRVALHTELRIRFNYGEWCPWVERREGAVYAVAGPDAVRITPGVPLTNENFASTADFSVTAGQSIAFTLEWFPSHQKPPVTRDAYALLARTAAEWCAWSKRCGYDGPYREAVTRSLLTLKALTYEPSGGIVAAATTSLPELPGGARNWDYRFCWLRDAALTLYALIGSGYLEEASEWRWWLMRAVGGSPEELQVMYGLHGERTLTEVELPWLGGYEDSRPVRVGNGAQAQRQLDVYGAVIAAFHASRKAGLKDMEKVWPIERAIARKLTKLWREPDCSLWEVRGELRHFVHSKFMCWLAFDRMIASAQEFKLDGPIDEWRAVRDEIHADVCNQGYDEASGSFVQYYGADTVDAALLLMPLTGFLPIHDPRVLGTIARIERELIFNGLVYRYRTEKGVDGLEGGEGAFLACSFWLANVYVAMGKIRKAKTLFNHLLSLGSDLGLYAEEYDPVAKRQLGNFPQAFSHIGLINSAHALASAAGGVWELADRDGKGATASKGESLIVVVIGVSASGKSTLGEALAEQLDCEFQDGDDLHPAANVRKMRAGEPLNDDDRAPWLDRIAAWMSERARAGKRGVVACSALKAIYRDRLRAGYANTAFVLLDPGEAVLRRRMGARKGHFMPPSLLTSQLRTLERPDASEDALTIEGDIEVGEACLQALVWLDWRRGRG